MTQTLTRTIALLLVLTLASGLAFAAGSKAKKPEDDRPGVADYNAGVKLMKKGEFTEAQAKFEAALSANDGMAEAHNNLAYSLRKQGPDHFDAALRHYNRAIELDSKLAEAYMYRGVLWVNRERPSTTSTDAPRDARDRRPPS